MANLPVGNQRYQPTGEDRKAYNLAYGRLEMSRRRYRSYHTTLRRLHRYYLSLSPRQRTRDNDRDLRSGDHSDIFIPMSFSAVEAAVPKMVFSQFDTRPYLRVVGRTQDDHQRAEAGEVVLDYDMEQARIVAKSVPAFKEFYKYGNAIGKVTWRRDFYQRSKKVDSIEYDFDDQGVIQSYKVVTKTVKEPVLRFDGPWFEHVSIYNFFPDPRYFDIDRMEFVIERRFSDRNELNRENERYKDLTGKNLYKNLDLIPEHIQGMVDDDYRHHDATAETNEAMGFAMESFYGRSQQYRSEEGSKDEPVVLHEYWEDDRLIILANGVTVIRDSPNPYDDKKKPYFGAPCFPIENEFFAMGILHPIRRLQEALNAWENLTLDQAKLNVQNVWAVDDQAMFPDNAEDIRPGKWLRHEFINGKPAIQPLISGQNLPPEAYQKRESFIGDIQTTIAFSDYILGAGGGQEETASQAKMITAAGGQRFRLQALLGEELYLTECGRKMFARRQQFFDEERIFRIAGDKGFNYKKITPEEIAGEYDFMPQGSQHSPNKEVLRQQMIQAFAVAGKLEQLSSITDWPEAWKEFWHLTDARHPERFVLVPPQYDEMTPDKENIILLAGERHRVKASDQHDKHLQLHQQAIAQVDPQNERAVSALMDHIEQHQRFMEGTQGGNSSQMPGMPQGHMGNQPNFDNAVPTSGSLEASVGGFS